MYERPYAYAASLRDVMAAWLVCLAVAGSLLIYPLFSAGAADPAAEVRALPHTMPAPPPGAICAVPQITGRISRG
jgi:hypothetical protein